MKNLLFFLLAYSFSLFSQERKSFYGTVIDDLNTLENVHIINVSTNVATNSNPLGKFKIFAKINDSIKITSVGYITKTIILKASDFGLREKQIHLKKEIIELDEIEIKNHQLTGNLVSDSKLSKPKKEINAKTLQLPYAGSYIKTKAERDLYTAMGGSETFKLGLANSVSLDYIINSLSGRLNNLKKLKKIEDNEKEISYLKNQFKNYIITDLKINSTKLSRFIYYCQESPDYNTEKLKSEFAIIEFLKKKALTFKKLNKKQ